MKAYLVGGAVRDELLGRVVSDFDHVVTGATVKQMLAFGFTQVGADFPVFLHPLSKEEYALARTERKSGAGHKGFNVEFNASVTLEDDLLRRDLTINAIAKGTDGGLVDPFGGQDDLEHRILRHVSLAFVEDPLRVLRVARFAAQLADLGFSVHPQTMELMTQLAHSGELSHLTPERVFKETDKALKSDAPQVFFKVLQDCGALAELMPQIKAVDAVAIARARVLSDMPQVCWAVVVDGCNEEHQILNQRLKVPSSYAYLANKLAELKPTLDKVQTTTAQGVVELLASLDCYRKPEQLVQFIAACQSLAVTDEYPQGEYLQRCYEVCAAVIAKPFVDEGYKGAQISEQVNLARVKAVSNL
jgi:tRNA nucleotidyltransferase (CCA-adding enzyme)